jgi:hypothetical protein
MSLRARVASLSVGAPVLHIVFDNVFDETSQTSSVE